MAAPFFTVYMLRTLEVSFAQIAIFSAIQTIATIIMNPFWGYLADKYGYKPVMSLTAMGLAVFPLGWGFVTLDNYWIMVPLVQVWGGSMSAGWGTGPVQPHRQDGAGGQPLRLPGMLLRGIERVRGLRRRAGRHRRRSVCLHTRRIRLRIHLRGAAIPLPRQRRASNLLHGAAGPPGLRFPGFFPDVINRVRKGNPFATLWHLVRMGKSSNPSVRARAARELGETGSHLAVDELIALLDDSDRNVRREAVQSLSRIGAEEAVNPLLECVGSPSSDIAEEAVEALGAVPSSLSLNILVTLLHDERPGIRRSAILALDRIGDRRAESALEALLEHERDPAIVQSALETLARMGNTGILGRLQDLIRTSETSLQRGVLVMSAGHLLGAPDLLYRLLAVRRDGPGPGDGEDIPDRPPATGRLVAGRKRRQGPAHGRRRPRDERFRAATDRGDAEAAHGGRPGRRRGSAYGCTGRYFRQGDPPRVNLPRVRTIRGLAHRVLADLESEGRRRTLHPEERLLAVVALQRIADLGHRLSVQPFFVFQASYSTRVFSSGG